MLPWLGGSNLLREPTPILSLIQLNPQRQGLIEMEARKAN